ncbi:MAG: 2-oxoglutarate dehydrogenase E1 component [Proteobacteria bacterium]|nr:2-oxoglutarate dehydrogenase E1 component [Pseudomonadota bacterium]MDA1180854.1 2-oxoglutarate dehydrogenase E1 component [Pseudomonadota bacterium]
MNDSFLNSANAPYVAELYFKYTQNPKNIDESWKSFFSSLNEDELSIISDFGGPEWKKRDTNVIDDISFDKVVRSSSSVDFNSFKTSTLDSIRALRLIRAYRINGHLIANLDPLNLHEKIYHPELDYKSYGFSENDLDREIFIDGSLGLETATLKEIIQVLNKTYASSIGVEFLHIQSVEQKQWVQERIEEVHNKTNFTTQGKKAIFQRLVESELFEQYLDKKFLGTKRYGVEGGESMIPGIEQIVKQSCIAGVQDIYFGTAHRGRLTLLATVLGMPYRGILSKFQGSLNDPNEVLGSGDVKYHLGVSSDREFDGKSIHLSLTPNPSHLEAVDPVVAGKVRAKQTLLQDKTTDKVFGILIHGDAAMAGQGIVAETFAMSQLRGFRTGGTIHFVINNQIGFTTTPHYGRSAPYCTEIAKMVQAPIFHVNGDDPEAVVHVCRLAAEYRNLFKEDVVVDMFCYRRSGHNEADEPMFTQPLMYKKIKQHQTTLNLYKDQLIKEEILSEDEAKTKLSDFKKFLDNEFELSKSYKPNKVDWLDGTWTGIKIASIDARRGKTSSTEDDLKILAKEIHALPDDFTPHKRIKKIYNDRQQSIVDGKNIDWATAEALAFATLLKDGYGVRLSGQDVGRGTFSHRHAVLYDQENEKRFVPLRHFRKDQALFEIVDSFLSEFGVLGFEYGYSQADPKTLVIWEAQFGDFSNGAQTIIDQFITTGERKWLRMSGLTLLLPHGHEGQGPEHTSSRLERFLQMCAEDNIQVANCTSPANYFHILRRQMMRDFRKPLILMTPKSTLRHKGNTSPLEDFVNGSSFHRVLRKPITKDEKSKINRVVLCSGKIYFELQDHINELALENIHIIRLEQLYPFPYEALEEEIVDFKNCEMIWCQEEPRNMGAWQFIQERIQSVLQRVVGNDTLHFIGRRAAASPATGVFDRHLSNQQNIIRLATEANLDEIKKEKSGVSLVKYKLPIE